MNTFILSMDTKEAAKFHCNKHVVKMILESAQMLCTAHWLHLLKDNNRTMTDFRRVKDAQVWLYKNTDPDLQPPWKLTHARHPCTLWTSENVCNYNWQLSLCEALLREYQKRYHRVHKTTKEAKWLWQNFPINISDSVLTDFPVCMKEEYKIYKGCDRIDVVASYRNYYIKDKVRFAKWEPRSKTPKWFLKGIENE